tara:strand:+ start:6842 stop:7585 length:744 start_codon:yes stop_codon:yes gene_type:complete
MKTSVVIPATNGNFGYLNCILRHYEDGVEIPDEIVVSISNSHLVDSGSIDALENKFKNSFELKVLRHEETMLQGPNRDAASKQSTGDIIISNDADDIPHPQRVDIIKRLFKENDIVQINHGYQINTDFSFVENMQVMQCEDVFNHHFPNCPDTDIRPNPHDLGFHAPYGGGLPWTIHAGNVAFSKEVFDELSWRHTEEIAWDYDFCMDVLFRFKRSMIIDAPLIWYNLLNTRRTYANPKDLGNLFKE